MMIATRAIGGPVHTAIAVRMTAHHWRHPVHAAVAAIAAYRPLAARHTVKAHGSRPGAVVSLAAARASRLQRPTVGTVGGLLAILSTMILTGLYVLLANRFTAR